MWTLCFPIALFMTLLFSFPLNALILLNDVMNKEMRKQTGIADLTYQQRLMIEKWLNDTFILKDVKEKKTDQQEIYLSQNIDGGQLLELSDGSRWEVSPHDLHRTATWLIPFPLKIIFNDDPQDAVLYPHVIINQNTGIGVKVRMINSAVKIYPKEP